MIENVHHDVHPTIERVARESYGRLVAYLSSRTYDVASAEDALSSALLAALTSWPRDGVPSNPEAWLLTSARRSAIDAVRHQHVIKAAESTLTLLAESSTTPDISETHFPDERLKLLFVCAHPALDPAIHAPLMLQTVLGLDAARIAAAFLISPKTMGQRLVRAKTKIRRSGIHFEVPQAHHLPERLDAVLDAIYAAFGIGWDDMAGADQRGRDLAAEAVWLARVLHELMPSEPEVSGLLALMLHCEARRAARRGPQNQYVPLSEQDPRKWSIELITEAERHLSEAAKHQRSGRFQFEAAIQSVHAERARTGITNWKVIAHFYQQLVLISPAIGTQTSFAVATAEAHGPVAGLTILDAIDSASVFNYQPYWAVRAHLLRRSGRVAEASIAYDRAIALSEDPAIREFLLQKRG